MSSAVQSSAGLGFLENRSPTVKYSDFCFVHLTRTMTRTRVKTFLLLLVYNCLLHVLFS